MKVGANREANKSIYYSYRHVRFDSDGWADANHFLPGDYDLVSMLCSNGRILPGWSVGYSWEGLNYKKEKHKIIAWKRRKEDVYYNHHDVTPPRIYRFLGKLDNVEDEL